MSAPFHRQFATPFAVCADCRLSVFSRAVGADECGAILRVLWQCNQSVSTYTAQFATRLVVHNFQQQSMTWWCRCTKYADMSQENMTQVEECIQTKHQHQHDDSTVVSNFAYSFTGTLTSYTTRIITTSIPHQLICKANMSCNRGMSRIMKGN